MWLTCTLLHLTTWSLPFTLFTLLGDFDVSSHRSTRGKYTNEKYEKIIYQIPINCSYRTIVLIQVIKKTSLVFRKKWFTIKMSEIFPL